MKKKVLATLLTFAMTCTMLAACGKAETADNTTTPTGADAIATPIVTEDANTETPEVTEADAETPVVIDRNNIPYLTDADMGDGMIMNELSGEPMSADIADQRPLAVMVDNELTALDHFGLDDAEIVYEMVNSTLNGRITRLMCLVKDWKGIEQFGSVRSARVTNTILTAEWNAILCHDGGPYYINDYTALDIIDNISGGFSRIDNGKPSWYTEYICQKDVNTYIPGRGYSLDYNTYYTGDHFDFVAENATAYSTFSKEMEASDVVSLKEAFPHNSSELYYNAETGLYEYYEYGNAHVDGKNGNVLTFKNLIIQKAEMTQLDENGYMFYTITGEGEGYYIADGKAYPITWSKSPNLCDNTQYLDADGNPIILNAGRTYIAIVPTDAWDTIVIK